ncbi:MAG: shikimate kinase [Chloroflexota bacterium]
MRRICIIGATGSGKSTLGRAIAERLGLRYVELDALHWDPGWTEAPPEIFLQRIAQAVRDDGWVTDGNYSLARPLTLDRADTIIWIDLPFWTTLGRLVMRTVRRLLTGEELWNGNRERLWTQLFSRDSIFLWLIKTYPQRQEEYPVLLERYAKRGHAVFRLRSQTQIEAWLADLPNSEARQSTG